MNKFCFIASVQMRYHPRVKILIISALTFASIVMRSTRAFEDVRVIMTGNDEHTLVELGRFLGVGKEAWLGAIESVVGKVAQRSNGNIGAIN